MGRIPVIILFLAILADPLQVGAEEISFQATVDKKELTMDDRLTYTLTVTGAREAQPELGEIKGFEVLGSSTSTQVSISNGQTQISKSFQYNLIPLQEAVIVIPSATMRYGGRTYKTHPIVVRVVENKPAAPSAGAPARRLFVKTEVDKKEAYVNQQITLTFKLYASQLRISDLQYTPSPTVGFLQESLGGERSYRETLGGLRYEVVELKKAIFPISSGEMTVGPAELRGNKLIPKETQRRGFIDDLFEEDFFFSPFRYQREPFLLRSQPIELTIKPLPAEGRPKTFGGSVGSFSLGVEASPRTVRVGEPITVTMKITGAGNLDAVTIPHVATEDRYKSYAPEVETRRMVAGEKVAGEKIFKQVLIPLQPGQQHLPPVIFSYFDPDEDKYKTVRKAPIPITVAAAPEGEELRLVEAPSSTGAKRGIELLKKDILYIKDNPGDFRKVGREFYQSRLYWGAHLLPLLFLLLVWRVKSRQEKIRSDLVYARRIGASRAARRRFKEARRYLKEGSGEKFYQEAHRAFIRYLGDKLGLPSGAVDPEAVVRRLEPAGADPRVLDEVRTCFQTCDRARFAPGGADRAEMAKFLETVERLIGQLEKLRLK